MIIHDHDQGSAAWHQARAGLVTASIAKRLVTPAKLDPVKNIEPLAMELAAAVLKGSELDQVSGVWAMERGKELEPIARRRFQADHDIDVEEVGFCTDPLNRYGCSPDGLIFSNETVIDGLEIKCPLEKEFIEVGHAILTTGQPTREYILQPQLSMLVTELDHWQFMIYHPDFEPVYATIKRNDDIIETMKAQITKINTRRDEIVAVFQNAQAQDAA